MKGKTFLNILFGMGLLFAVFQTGAAPSAQAAPDFLIHYVTPTAAGNGSCDSWANACGLQKALATSVSGDQIWVAAGTYVPTDTVRTVSFVLKNGVSLYGGYNSADGSRDWESNLTILSGDIGVSGNASDNSYHVVMGIGLTTKAVLDGFTMRDGNANNPNSHWAWGGGLYVENSNLDVRNVTFTYNSANGGGGMFSNGASQPLTLDNVQFIQNHAYINGGGLHTYSGSKPVLTSVTFTGNSSAADGGGMYNSGSSPTLVDATFYDNDATQNGGGMYNTGSSAILTDTLFIHNSAKFGGGLYNNSSSQAKVVNAIFSGNSASTQGGGIYTYTSSPTFINVTFSGNSAGTGGGQVMYSYSSNPGLRNCILWGNGAPGQAPIVNASSAPNFSNCDIQGSGGGLVWIPAPGVDGGGNIDLDPLFVDADGADGVPGTLDDNLRLRLDSPAAETGNNAQVTALTDLDGNPRIINSRVDMGAYEFVYPQPPAIIYVDWAASGGRNGGSWTDGLKNLYFALAWARAGVADYAMPGVEVWVAKGDYKPAFSNDRQVSFPLSNGVSLYGSFLNGAVSKDGRDFQNNASVLNGDLKGNDGPNFANNGENSYHVVSAIGVSTRAVLDGFWITNGNGLTNAYPWQWGGGLYTENSNLEVRNVTFRSNSANGGGAMFSNGGSQPVSLDNVRFIQNRSLVNGGGLHTYNGSNPTLTNVSFFTNTAATRGGGMYNIDASPVLSNAQFSGNTAIEGGGIYTQNGNPSLDGITFTNNSASQRGGGMCDFNSASTIENSTFVKNSAGLDGGGFYNNNSTTLTGRLSLKNVTFYTNTAVSTGGGMHLYYTGNPILTSVTFSGNRATGSGGGLFNNYGGPQLTDVTFSKNEATNNDGGGMYNTYATAYLSDVHFNGNKARQSGGGLFNTSNPTLSSVTFTENTATAGFGGGMYNSGDPTMDDIHFDDNHATIGGGMNNVGRPVLTGSDFINNTASFEGGGMNTTNSPKLTGIIFKGNWAPTGGGMKNGGNPELTDTAFISNTVSGNGGGMFNNAGSPKLTRAAFNGNSAASGGGIYSIGGSPVVVKASFDGNSSSQTGGGMYNFNSSPTILQTVFYTNTAVVSGGGMYNGGCTALIYPNLADVLFNNNSATGSGNNGNGGGLNNDNCAAVLTNVTFFYNHAVGYGGGVYEAGLTPLKLRNSLLWGNTGAGTTYDNQFVGSKAEVKNTTMQGSDADPSPFINANGADGIPGNRDDDLHPTYPSGKIIDGGLETNLPPDLYDLDGDGKTTNELLPVDLDGHPRIYADNDGDGVCDPVNILETDLLSQVDQGAYEAGCWAWHMQTGNKYLVEGRDYRLGFHNEINGPATITISDTLTSYAEKRAEENLKKARTNFEWAARCAGNTIAQTHQATLGMLDAIWELATAAMLQGNEEMVQALDVSNSQGSYAADIARITRARDFYDAAVKGYLEPIAGDHFNQLLETLTISRTSPLTSTVDASLVDLERLGMASSGKSRANLELAERQFRNSQSAEAKQTLENGQFQARLEMSLLETLWPGVVDTVDYTDLVRSLGDMDRMHGYIVSGKNPLGYDPGYVPFSFSWLYPDLDNFQQSWLLAEDDLSDAQGAITAAANKQKEVDDNYVKMQTRLQEAQDKFDDNLGLLCGNVEVSPGVFEPDREHCSGGSIQEQENVVDNAMLGIDRVLVQMENQNALIKIEQDRIAAEKGIRYATVQLITETGDQLASLAKQVQEIDVDKSAWGGIKAFVKGAISGASPLGVATPKLSFGKMLMGGVLGGLTGTMDWKAQNERAEKLGNMAYKQEQLRAKQQARIEYAEAQIADANSEALQKQYMLKFAELDIDLAMAINNLEKELAHLVNLQNQAAYYLAEQTKAEAFNALLYRDPAGRVLRENYMEMAHASYERALESAYRAGKALDYQVNPNVNEGVKYTGEGPLSTLDDIYPLQDSFYLTQALDQMENSYNTWINDDMGGPPPSLGPIYGYLSLAKGFVDNPGATKEKQFNDFVKNPANRTDQDHDGCPELNFSFQTTNQPGNLLLIPDNAFNDRIDSIEMRIFAYDKAQGLYYGTEQPLVSNISLTQGGTSILRTWKSRIQSGGLDDLRYYNLVPRTTVLSAVNDSYTGSVTPPDPNGYLRSRSVAATEWTIRIEGGNSAGCGYVNLDNIGDILLLINHKAYGMTLANAPAGSEDWMLTPLEQSIQPHPSLSMDGALPVEDSSSPVAVSADNDLKGLFVGTVAITQPDYLPSSELSLQLNDVGGVLTGYISPTLAFPADPVTGHGPALTGSWSCTSFSLQSQPFVTHVSQDIEIIRTIRFESGVISTTQTTRFLSGVYVETLAGLTPQPLEMRGVFQVQRPLRLLQAGFDASPKVVSTGDNVFFSDLSVGNPTSWSWSFGDGGTSNQQNPVHSYAALGEYAVSLTVGDGSGNNTLTRTGFISVIAANAAPTAAFSASPLEGPAPLTVSFLDHSVGGATSWLWEFGDGKTSTQRNPSHIYALEGSYTVSLTASNTYGSNKFTWEAYINVTGGEPPKRTFLPIVKN